MTNPVRLLFVIPPYFNLADHLTGDLMAALPAFTLPYGVLSMAAYVQGKVGRKVKVDILDLNVHALRIIKKESDYHETYFADIVKDRVSLFRPTVVGVSALFNTSYNDLDPISCAVKQVDGLILVLAGGGLPTNLHQKVLQECSCIDAICFGEGEIPLVDLLNSEDFQKALDEHPSWVSRASLKNRKVMSNSFVINLDEIPQFNYSLINLDDYNSRSLDKRHSGEAGKREMSIHTSRGCPFKCVFCSNGNLHGKKVRFMSVDKVINEVSVMKLQYGATVLLIEDDHFFADIPRAKVILDRLSEFGLRIEFPNGLTVYAVDEEVGSLLKKAGVSSVSLAIESGSDYVLKVIIKKPLKASMIKDRALILKKNGIIVHAFIVLGLPGEMDEHRLETENMLLDVGFDWVHIFLGIPVVGSRLYDICKENGYLINGDMKDHIISKANIRAPGVEPGKIDEDAYLMNLRVNFVNNWNMSRGNYDRAASYFQNVVNKYPDHAFANYYLAKCYKQMESDKALILKCEQAFKSSVAHSEKWRSYANHFALEEKMV